MGRAGSKYWQGPSREDRRGKDVVMTGGLKIDGWTVVYGCFKTAKGRQRMGILIAPSLHWSFSGRSAAGRDNLNGSEDGLSSLALKFAMVGVCRRGM